MRIVVNAFPIAPGSSDTLRTFIFLRNDLSFDHIFYRIQIRAVWRQIEIFDPGCVQYLFYCFCVMEPHIVHHNDVTPLKVGNKVP